MKPESASRLAPPTPAVAPGERNIVVIGGGFAGTTLVKALDLVVLGGTRLTR